MPLYEMLTTAGKVFFHLSFCYFYDCIYFAGIEFPIL